MTNPLSLLRRPMTAVVVLGLVALGGCELPPRIIAPGRSSSPVARVPVSTTTTTPPASGQSGHFGTMPAGAALPSDAACSAAVRPGIEIRPQNATFNHTVGSGPQQTTGYYARVTGNFTGTTDEIIQWGSCKWGIDEDIVRAQTAKESGWSQQATGDFTHDQSICVPGHAIGADGHAGQCPESIGLMQVRYQYLTPSFPMARDSSAYNLDEALAARRECLDGQDTWLNTITGGQPYGPGDIWGCVGLWFAGRWHTPAADTYTAQVQDYYNTRIWETPGFRTWTPS